MQRRDFLKATLFTSAAWVVGKNADASLVSTTTDTLSTYSNPVAFIDSTLGDSLFATDFSVDTSIDAQTVFTLGIGSGDPRPNGIVLWTRVDPAGMRDSSNPGKLGLEISTDPNFSNSSLLIRAKATLSADSDYTAKLPIAKSVLLPGQAYYYRFIYDHCASRTGQFRTLPAADSSIDRVRLAYISCQDYSNGYYTALANLANENVDYVVFLGDYIYETISDPSFQNQQVRTVPPLPSGNTAASSLADYRHLYRTYRGDANLQRLHERFTFIQIWDDHEFANDCWQDYHPDNNPAPEQPLNGLRQAANQAWVEYGLADVPFDPTAPSTSSVRNYRSFTFGQLFDLVVTDERLYRDGPPCGDSTQNRYLALRCSAAESPTRTMLGTDQRNWFLDTMTASKAIWKLWANEVTLMQMRLGTQFVTLDQWDGYPAERANILSSLALARVNNLVAITGDIHSFIAGYLMTDFDRQTAPVGVELVVGSITSANFEELILSQLPLPSAPIPLPPPYVDGTGFEDAVRLVNPHMQYFNSSSHGYCLLDITPQSLTCTMRAVNTIRQPQSSVFTLKQFVVPRDQVQLQTV